MDKKDTIFCASEEERENFFDNNTNLIYIIHDLDEGSYFPFMEDWNRLPDFNNSVMGYYQNGYHQEIYEIYEYDLGNGFLKRFNRNDKKWYLPILPEINNGDLLFVEIKIGEYEYYMGIVVKREGQRTIVLYNDGDCDYLDSLLRDEDVNILVVDNKSSSFKNFSECLSLFYNNKTENIPFKFISNDFDEAYRRFWKI